MKKKEHIFSILFSVYFFIFTASPLVYTYGHKEIITQTDVSMKNLRIFAIDLLLPVFMQDVNQDNKSSSPVHILLKKKRATLSSEKTSDLKNIIKNPIIVYWNFIFAYEISHVTIVVQTDGPKPQRNYYLSYSGISPPLA